MKSENDIMNFLLMAQVALHDTEQKFLRPVIDAAYDQKVEWDLSKAPPFDEHVALVLTNVSKSLALTMKARSHLSEVMLRLSQMYQRKKFQSAVANGENMPIPTVAMEKVAAEATAEPPK